MASVDRSSIFRQRALDKYMQRQELHVILRLVSPRMFKFLWILLLLVVGAGALVWSVQEPILVQGKGAVVQPKAVNGKATPAIVVLLLLPPDQQANLKVGQPVTISISGTNITFNSTIQTIEAGVMSPAAISTQINLQVPLSQTIAGPSVVATATVQPMSLAQTYLGSQCMAQVQIGSQSTLSVLPGFENVAPFLNNVPMYLQEVPTFATSIWQNINQLFNN